MNSSLQSKIKTSIVTIQKAAKLAQNYTGKPLVVAFSGGKDSQTVYHLAEAAGVEFEAVYSATTIDPPEVVRFIRKQYSNVKFHVPKLSFWRLAENIRMLPNRHMRYCCAVLKEATSPGRVTLTGVRREESIKRAKRQILDINKKPRQFDEFDRNETTDVQCFGNGKEKITVNPILDWMETDVWRYLNTVVKVPHCELYDIGRHRVGCLFCPMKARKEIVDDMQRYPHQFKRLKMTVAKIAETSKEFPNEPKAFLEWWLSDKPVQEFKAARLPVPEVAPIVDLSFSNMPNFDNFANKNK